MRRHPALEPFSRDHNDALILARKLIEGRPGAVAELERLWIADLQPHFAAEERLLLPFLSQDEAHRLLAEHAALAQAIAAPANPQGAGRLLHDHVRWEERTLFPAVEARLPPGDMAALASSLGLGERSAEGMLFPDTYLFPRGTSDEALLRQAKQRLESVLAAAWEARQPGLPLADPYEALILASIVEKETGAPDERPLIAGVFVNRLRLGMRLQTDPTVIYGLGAGFDGNLRRADLQRDTEYNTYTRAGLPPSPIALAGRAAIEAVTQPADTDALYFVATGLGDGRHRFARTLAEHNANVSRYILALRSARSGGSE